MLKKRFWTHGVGSWLLPVLVALFIRWAFMEAYVIPSGSMLPTLLINDHIFVNKSVYGIRVPFSERWLFRFGSPQRGDVIVFKYPLDKGTFFIKRVVGLPGDRVFYEDGRIYLNDREVGREPALEEGNYSYVRDLDHQRSKTFPYDTKQDYEHYIEDLFGVKHDILLRRGAYLGQNEGPWEVPEGQLFVMGDNRNDSGDSRQWGFVPEDYILGRAMFVWLSCEETLPILTFLCNPLTVRGSRFFHQIK